MNEKTARSQLTCRCRKVGMALTEETVMITEMGRFS